LVAVLASCLADESLLKPWLLIAAPSIAIFLSGLWQWASRRLSNWLRDREMNAVVSAARAAIKAALNDPHATSTHQESLRKRMELLDLLVVDRYFSRIESIRIVAEADPRSAGE
jgi:hypothetical protein